jgi:hypothetical protein
VTFDRNLSAAALAAALTFASAHARAEDPFEIRLFPQRGRTTAAELADFDGDDRADLFRCVFAGLPGRETRSLEIHYQRGDGTFPDEPDYRAPVPAGAAAYDVSDLDGTPGRELVFLTRNRVQLVSFADRNATSRSFELPGPSIAVAIDERGIDRMLIVRNNLAAKPRLLIPALAEAFVIDENGGVLARLATGARANYYMPSRDGALSSESEVELYLDAPRLASGDVDGDGRGDVVATSRYSIEIFTQREDGHFASDPDQTHALSLVEPEDFVRQSGSVRAEVADFDADGRADLLLAHTRGGLVGATTSTLLFRNRGGRFDIDHPDQRFESDGKGTVTHQLLDLDRDGRPELLEARIPLGALDLVELLVTKHLDAEVSIRRALTPAETGALFDTEPFFRRELQIAISFETLRPRGFIPTFAADLSGDGVLDLLGAGDGEALELYPGGGKKPYRDRSFRQALDTTGRIRFGKLRPDSLGDFLIYDPRRPEVPLRLGIRRADSATKPIPEMRSADRAPADRGDSASPRSEP